MGIWHNPPTRLPGKEVTAMDRESVACCPNEHEWETPTFEEIRVSAEATAYQGIWEDWG
jgi:coenzyme PQQ precursor peptide PqqA